ncbi:aldo/keto reductase [Alkalicoccus urumqiensis]|uniref:Aldo/keto reductase n=1 Tax=Alkalicoccus urumqiensis TaxID=1548213 RepID=A0A2P6MEG0_ALKUR|nr:aldo/keto reductase [Alkalicoccus urumqiensis]PRO64685.1 aldo/keto reductase [Alkalicoccus urumqiensis]
MNYRALGKTGLNVSELSFGTWAIGGAWGTTNDTEAIRGLETAMNEGVNFFDTADVYGDGHAEELLARATRGREQDIHIASKFCRAGDIEDPATYSEDSVRGYLEATLRRLNRDQLDLYQIHCPPKHIIEDGAVFDVLDKLKQEGKIAHYGVSVETVEEGLLSLEKPGVEVLQVIFNIFRQKPVAELFPKAQEKGAGIIARVPLASGLLTGKFKEGHEFEADDHRRFNSEGQAFNVGETFGGVPFSAGVALAQELEWIAEGRNTMTQASLRWILDHEAVSTVIPGFKRVDQVQDTLQAVKVPSFSKEEMDRLTDFYDRQVHDLIRGAY